MQTKMAIDVRHPDLIHFINGSNSLVPLAIFDLDNTISITAHRDHHIKKTRRTSADWDAFYAACEGDAPNIPVVLTLNHLRCSGWDIKIFSGRRMDVHAETIRWLNRYTVLTPDYLEENLLMRPIGDNTEDTLMKTQWYNALSDHDKDRLICIYDDRDRVVNMWRSLGLTCFQVQPGDF